MNETRTITCIGSHSKPGTGTSCWEEKHRLDDHSSPGTTPHGDTTAKRPVADQDMGFVR